jgi:hypothetical protein
MEQNLYHYESFAPLLMEKYFLHYINFAPSLWNFRSVLTKIFRHKMRTIIVFSPIASHPCLTAGGAQRNLRLIKCHPCGIA